MVIQTGRDLGLALRSAELNRISRERFGQDLRRHLYYIDNCP